MNSLLKEYFGAGRQAAIKLLLRRTLVRSVLYTALFKHRCDVKNSNRAKKIIKLSTIVLFCDTQIQVLGNTKKTFY
jgi:hypothetical protein